MSQVMSIRAGRKNVGDVAYDNYIGQIAPADISAIVWYGVGGDDTTGDGSFANPYLTFARAIEDVSATKIYVLETSLNGKYELTNKIYWDPTRPDDTGNGLTPATAKQTYAAAKAAAVLNGFLVIEAMGTFTMTDILDFKTQGEVGHTLTYNATSIFIEPVDIYTESNLIMSDFSINNQTGTIIAAGYISPSTFAMRRSIDGGLTWSIVTLPGTTQSANAAGVCVNGVWVVAALSRGPTAAIYRSVNDGVTWSIATIANRVFSDLVHTGSRFILMSKQPGGGNDTFAYWSTDGITWNPFNLNFTTPAQVYMTRMANFGDTIVAVGYRLILPNNNVPVIAVSTNGGTSWTNISNSLISSPGYTVPLSPASVWRNNDAWYIYAGNIWKSTDLVSWAIVQTNTVIVSDNGAMNPVSGARIDVSEVYGKPIVFGRITPSTDRGFISIDDSSATYESGHFAFLSIQAVVGQRILKYKNVEYHFSGVPLFPSSNGAIKRIPLLKANVFADAINLKSDTGVSIDLFEGIVVSQLTGVQPSGAAARAMLNCAFDRSWLESDAAALTAFGNKFRLKESVVASVADALIVNGRADIANEIDIDRSIIDGGYDLNNAGGTNLERCRDTIITGNFTAEAVTSMESGNVQGAVANVSLAPIVTAIDPLFIGSQYKLQRELIPPSVFDSYMVAQSTFYTNGMAIARDLGAWSGIEVNKETIYQREFAFLLPAKSDAVASIKHNRVNLWVSETGVPDVVNTPDGAWEELLMTYGSLPTEEFGRLKNHLEFLDWLETLTDMTVELRLDPNYTPSTSITTGAAAAVDQPFIIVGSGTVKSGYRITIAGKTYSVGLVSGVYAVLDRGLEDSVLNGATLEVASIIGYGTYQYIPQTDRRLTRWAHDRTDFMRGFILRFARKWV